MKSARMQRTLNRRSPRGARRGEEQHGARVYLAAAAMLRQMHRCNEKFLSESRAGHVLEVKTWSRMAAAYEDVYMRRALALVGDEARGGRGEGGRTHEVLMESGG